MDKSLDEKHLQSHFKLAASQGKISLIKIHNEIIVVHTKRSIIVRHRTEERQLVIDDVRCYFCDLKSIGPYSSPRRLF